MPSKWLEVIYNSNLICNDTLRVLAAGWLRPVLVFARASEHGRFALRSPAGECRNSVRIGCIQDVWLA